jgi:hypothetical protein
MLRNSKIPKKNVESEGNSKTTLPNLRCQNFFILKLIQFDIWLSNLTIG